MANNWQINAIAGLDGTQSRNQLNSDIKGLARNLDKLKLYAEIDKNQVTQLQHQLKNLQVQLNNVTVSDAVINGLVAKINAGLQNVTIGNINIGNVNTQAQQVGQQIGNNIAQGVNSGVSKATVTVKSFEKLTESMQSQKIIFNDEGLQNTKLTLDKIKETYAEFGQVKITNKIFNGDELQSFKVNIEQVNGELKETRSFMMSLSDNKLSFILPDDVIKGTEKYVQHLNAAKNATNATGEALNAQNQRLAEQAKYYGKIKEETNHLYSLKQKLLSADKLQTAELNKQIKSTKQRITYNNQQLDKKGLRDNSLEREINDLVVAREKQLALSDAKAQDTANTKAQAQAQREANAVLKEQQSLQERVNKIQLSTDITKIENDYKRFGIVSQEVENNLKELKIARENALKAEGTDNASAEIEKYNQKLAETKSSWKELQATQVSVNQRTSQMTSMQEWMRKNKNATKLCGDQVQKLIQECQTCDKVRFDQIKNEFKKLQVEAGKAGKLGNTLWGSLIEQGKGFIQWYGVSGVVTECVNAFRKMYTAVVEVDSAMVELRKVSDASSNDLKKYFDEAAKSAKDLGAAVSDVISATADWSRLGYNLDDSKKLAEVAILYKNVGDGIDINTANESLVSTLRGFKLSAEDAINIVDQFNEVANNFPIDSAGIGEALQRSAASFYEANTDLSKSIALITGTNSVIQDPDSVGTMWKTVSMRIRGATTELEQAGLETEGMVETTSQLRDLVKGMTGFDIMKDEDTFKDIYEIVIGIGQEWQNLSDIEQASLLEKLAGKRQGNALAAALNNISMIEDAYNTATNSAGSALEEQEEYEKGIQYSLDRLEAKFQEFSNHVLESELIKGIVDFGTTTLDIIDKVTSALGSLGTIGVIGGGILGAKNAGKCRMSVRISNCFEYALYAQE